MRFPWNKKQSLDEGAPTEFQDAWSNFVNSGSAGVAFPDGSVQFEHKRSGDALWTKAFCAKWKCKDRPVGCFFMIMPSGGITAMVFTCKEHYHEIQGKLSNR